MKTKTNQRISELDSELSQIFGDVLIDDTSIEDAVREAKLAFRLIKQDALYRNNHFLDMEDE